MSGCYYEIYKICTGLNFTPIKDKKETQNMPNLLHSGVLLYEILEESYSGMSVMAVSGNSIVTSIRKCDACDVITFSYTAFAGREGEKKTRAIMSFLHCDFFS